MGGTGAATVLRRFLQSTHKLLQAPAAREGGADPIVAGAALRALLHRGERLADDLLACSGRQPWDAVDVELLPLLASFAAMLRGTLDDRIKVGVDVSKACPPCRTDARALETALQHLAVNARDAMPRGGRLDLMAAPAWFADGSPAVAVTVLDGGHGMTEAVAGFARQSGGTVTIETWPGDGTRVTLRLRPAPPAA